MRQSTYMDLAREMNEWEVHSLRNLLAEVLFYVRQAFDSEMAKTEGAISVEGCLRFCEEAVEDHYRKQMVALRDADYRRQMLRN